MYTSKKYLYEYEDYEDGDKSSSTLVADILADPEFAGIDELIVGCWGEAWDDNDGAQAIIDGIVENKEKFAHIKSLFIGDMDFEECEVSWIIQGNYEKLWDAMPQLEKLVIKGSSGLALGTIKHENLKHLEIICGGLPADVIKEIQEAKLPSLETLLLYIGVEDYGFDGDASTVKDLLTLSDFPKLTYLGITDSEIQDALTEIVLDCKYMNQITTLDLSMGTMTDKGGQLILDKLSLYPNIKALNLEHNFLSDEMADKFCDLEDVDVNVPDQQEPDEWNGELYYYPMLTE